MKSKWLLLILLSIMFIGCSQDKQPTEIGACKLIKDPPVLCLNGELVILRDLGLMTPEYVYTKVHNGYSTNNKCTCQGVEDEKNVDAANNNTPYLEIAE